MSAPTSDAVLMDGDPGTTAVVHGMLATMAELLERLEDRLSTLEATVVGQTTATRTAAQRLATELPEAVLDPLRNRLERLDTLDERLAAVEAAVARPDTSALERRIDALAQAVAPPDLQALVDAVDAARSEMAATLERRLGGLEATLEAVTAGPDLAGLHAKLDGLAEAQEAVAALDARLDALADGQSAVAALDSKLDALAEGQTALADLDALAHLDAKLDALASLNAKLDGLAGAQAAVTALDAKLDGLAEAQAALASLDAKLDGLAEAQTALAGLDAKLDGLAEAQTALAGLDAKLDRLADGQAALEVFNAGTDLAALTARIEALATAVGAIQVSPGAVAAEVRAAVAEVAGNPIERPELSALLDERMAAVTAGIAELLATAGAPPADPGVLARNLARLEADLAEARAEMAMAVQAVAERVESAFVEARVADEEALRRAVGAVEAVAAHATGNANGNGKVPDGDGLARLADRVGQVFEAVNRTRGETTSAVDDMAARLARIEAVVVSAHDHEDARATALASELQSILGAGLERLLTHASSADDVLATDMRSSLARLTEVAASVESLTSTVATVADGIARLAADDRGRSAVAAVEAAHREQHEALSTFHASILRRIDGRTAALARLLEGIDIERLATEVADRQATTTRLLEQVAAALGDEQRRLETVQSLCQSVAGAVEQQAAVGSRVAELVLETRSAMRSDVERLESGLHLDSVKRQQLDQARLAQLAAGVTEVVERETSLVAQRVAALASTVESLRNGLHVTLD